MKLAMRCKIAVLISNTGTGTNLQAIIDGVESGKINAKIAAVISDTDKAQGLQKARKYHLPIKIIPKKEELLKTLQSLNLDYICLAGWKQIILDEVIRAFPNKILNTHPGLISDTLDGIVKNPDGTKALWNKGKMTEKAMQNFLDNKSTFAGCTNHFLSLKFDFGPVLGRCFEKVRKGDNVCSLYTRLKKKENKLYAGVLAKLCSLKTVLVVDAGGRGAALVDKYAQSEQVGRILAVPGNDLMQINTSKEVKTYPGLKTTSVKEIIQICKQEKVALVDVAQDNAVEVGLVDKLQKIGISVLGPTRKAGQIEWDKAWARKFMHKYHLPSPQYHIFSSEKEGIEFLSKYPDKQWFVKAAGLAEGKGAIPAASKEEAIAAIKQMSEFGTAGKTFLLEEWLIGEEFSAFALSDGQDFKIVGYAQDHKRVFDDDQGHNTGGMGCVSNPLVVNHIIKKQVTEIFEKTVKGLIKENRPYQGVLYLGGIVVGKEVKIIEFNARWGDPEAESILPGINNDLYILAEAMISGQLAKLALKTDKKVRIAVATCSKGYPVDYSKVLGKRILGIERIKEISGIRLYGAGVKKLDQQYVVSGGRILFLVGEGKDILEARKHVYQAVKLINVEGNNLHFRTDIGWRDVERKKK